MKYLSDYTQEAQTELFDKTKAFFAFNNDQFEKGIEAARPSMAEGEKFVSLGGGMYCPRSTADQLVEGLNSIQKMGIELDLKENGRKKIILRELDNHECFYTGDISDAVDVLKPYGITEEDVYSVYTGGYREKCAETW